MYFVHWAGAARRALVQSLNADKHSAIAEIKPQIYIRFLYRYKWI